MKFQIQMEEVIMFANVHFAMQRKLQEYFCEETKDEKLVDLSNYHYVYNKPVEKFSKLKKVYKHDKDFSKRIEIEM